MPSPFQAPTADQAALYERLNGESEAEYTGDPEAIQRETVGPEPVTPGGGLEAVGSAGWALDADSPCYAHLGEAIAHQPFELTARVLEGLAALNHFHQLQGDRVLFGLRGCELADGGTWTELEGAVSLREAVPDHARSRCVLGVWDRPRGLVGVVQGSTVPDWSYMSKQVAGSSNCNMLPTGLYAYRVGVHKGYLQGALRSDSDYVVVRSRSNLVFTRGDTWTGPANVFDNIHPGWRQDSATSPWFDSAGCQTVPGSYDRDTGRHWGLWAQLRHLAGLSLGPAPDELGRALSYMLLTGREARLFAMGTPRDRLARLRPGSSGPAVLALTRALAAAGEPLEPTATWDGRVTRRVVNWQWHRNGDAADCVLLPAEAAELGVRVFDESLRARFGAVAPAGEVESQAGEARQARAIALLQEAITLLQAEP